MSAAEVAVSTGTLLTITTGLFLTESFADFHHAADVLAAQPLMTHQFASKRLADQLANEAKRQHPWTADPLLMDDFPNLDALTSDEAEAACRAWVAQHSEKHGDRHLLTSPPEARHVPLVEGLPAKFGGAG